MAYRTCGGCGVHGGCRVKEDRGYVTNKMAPANGGSGGLGVMWLTGGCGFRKGLWGIKRIGNLWPRELHQPMAVREGGWELCGLPYVQYVWGLWNS